MDFQVLYSERALIDLEEVMLWSWQNHPGTTERFANSLLNHVDLLKTYPYLGAALAGFPGVRWLQHSPLQIYYQVLVESRRVEILNFWHRARRRPRF